LIIKRLFDIVVSALGLLFLAFFLFSFFFLSSIDTQSTGLFTQKRIGQYGKPFTIFKLRTIHPKTGNISNLGKWLRKYKIDELPQLLNVLLGSMSIVGPRPDVEGYYDQLQGEERKILNLKPGLTSPAALKYLNEEYLLNQQPNPQHYNDSIIFPDKVKMNLEYYHNQSFINDLKIMGQTIQKLLLK
jgi:lipopolysaccharide/colanic/teichoic acid biosynthesis glycosyltransferase